MQESINAAKDSQFWQSEYVLNYIVIIKMAPVSCLLNGFGRIGMPVFCFVLF